MCGMTFAIQRLLAVISQISGSLLEEMISDREEFLIEAMTVSDIILCRHLSFTHSYFYNILTLLFHRLVGFKAKTTYPTKPHTVSDVSISTNWLYQERVRHTQG